MSKVTKTAEPRKFYRTLALTVGRDKDREGIELGRDHLVADLGVAEDPTDGVFRHFYVTTNGIPTPAFDPEAMGCDAPSLAAEMVALLDAKMSPAARRKEREPTAEEVAASFELSCRKGDANQTRALQMYVGEVRDAVPDHDAVIERLLAPSNEHAIPQDMMDRLPLFT